MPCEVNEKGLNACAHEASKVLQQLNLLSVYGPGELWRTSKDGLCLCNCGQPVRAKELRDFYLKKGYKTVQQMGQGTYLVYQEQTGKGQGHVFVKHQGKNYGNGNYNWQCDSQIFIYLK